MPATVCAFNVWSQEDAASNKYNILMGDSELITFGILPSWQVMFSTKWLHVPISTMLIFLLRSVSFFEMTAQGKWAFSFMYNKTHNGPVAFCWVLREQIRELKTSLHTFYHYIQVPTLDCTGHCVCPWNHGTLFLTLPGCNLVRDKHCIIPRLSVR